MHWATVGKPKKQATEKNSEWSARKTFAVLRSQNCSPDMPGEKSHHNFNNKFNFNNVIYVRSWGHGLQTCVAIPLIYWYSRNASKICECKLLLTFIQFKHVYTVIISTSNRCLLAPKSMRAAMRHSQELFSKGMSVWSLEGSIAL